LGSEKFQGKALTRLTVDVDYIFITRAKIEQRHNPDNAEEFISTPEIL
jgi:hypothetical protein